MRKKLPGASRMTQMDNYNLSIMNQEKRYNVNAKVIINFEGKLKYSHNERFALPMSGLFDLEPPAGKKLMFDLKDVELPPEFTLPD